MPKHKIDFSRAISSGGNPHDYFGRVTIGDPMIAADVLRHYDADSIIAKHVDLNTLQAEPTEFFGPPHPVMGPKEVRLDVPYIACLHDKEWKSEVLIVTEHKSSPNLFCPLQLGAYALMSLYKRWTDKERLGWPETTMNMVFGNSRPVRAKNYVQKLREEEFVALCGIPASPQAEIIQPVKTDYRRDIQNFEPGSSDYWEMVENTGESSSSNISGHFSGI